MTRHRSEWLAAVLAVFLLSPVDVLAQFNVTIERAKGEAGKTVVSGTLVASAEVTIETTTGQVFPYALKDIHTLLLRANKDDMGKLDAAAPDKLIAQSGGNKSVISGKINFGENNLKFTPEGDMPEFLKKDLVNAIYFLRGAVTQKPAAQADKPHADRAPAELAQLEAEFQKAVALQNRLRVEFQQAEKRVRELSAVREDEWALQNEPLSRNEVIEDAVRHRAALRAVYRAEAAKVKELRARLTLARSLLPPPARDVAFFKEAFPHLPAVKVVPVSPEDRLWSSPEAPGEQERETMEAWARQHGLPAIRYAFDAPAHFPLPQFGAGCEVLEVAGLLIHEGMRLVVTAEGLYEVRFTASAPAMPVTLRLQLTLTDEQDRYGRPITLTLPPITIEPAKDLTRTDRGDSWQVRHVGYCPSLAGHFPSLTQASPVIRDGTARFGSWPPQ